MAIYETATCELTRRSFVIIAVGSVKSREASYASTETRALHYYLGLGEWQVKTFRTYSLPYISILSARAVKRHLNQQLRVSVPAVSSIKIGF